MQRIPVNSSALASIGYDAAKQVLELEFHKTGIYHYFNVPTAVYEEMLAASSLGSYLNGHIKGRYPYKRI